MTILLNSKPIENWLFDLDNTLYPKNCNLFAQIDKKICDFIQIFLNLSQETAYNLQKKYFKDYGTSLSGLMKHHNIIPNNFLSYVHDIDYSNLSIDSILQCALDKLPGRKFIFTNGSYTHAQSVLERLGINHCFEIIFDIAAADYIPKPQQQTYQKIIDTYNLNPQTTVMIDDMPHNLAPAASMGMMTLWVHDNPIQDLESLFESHIHFKTDNLSTWLQQLTVHL
ncbi:MAG: pyrimidine 5'-nucleotidase [Alphaproteobacteria bacterium]|nr:pyrimidine 5'-nucleotidase [Alphaproteobacteria bacterium]